MASVSDLPAAGEPADVSRATRRSGKGPLLVVLLLAIVSAGGLVWARTRNRVSTDDATVDGHVAGVASKIAGNVIEVLVRDNQAVGAGEPILRIDPRDYQAKVRQAQAAVAQALSHAGAAKATVPWTRDATESAVSAAIAQLADANAELERAQITVDVASGSDLAFSEATVRSRQAAAERAGADLKRMQSLAEREEISRLQFDAYNAAARIAQSELEAAREKFTSAGKDIGIRQASLKAARTRVQQAQAAVEAATANRMQLPIRTADAGTASAGVEAARANLEAAELQLGYCTVFAPIGGTVTRKSVEPGNVVAPGQNLMAIVRLDDVWVTANFKETQLAKMRPGQRAELFVDTYGRKVQGKVDSIASATGSRLSLLPAENASGNFVKVVQRIPVKILIDPGAGLTLRPGMNVEAVVFLD
jgi:membrane fusion protein, multidrug efflux system